MLLTFLAPMAHTLEKGVPFGLSLTEGMVVQGIAPHSQAADRGVLLGSRLVAIDVSRIHFINKEVRGVGKREWESSACAGARALELVKTFEFLTSRQTST